MAIGQSVEAKNKEGKIRLFTEDEKKGRRLVNTGISVLILLPLLLALL